MKVKIITKSNELEQFTSREDIIISKVDIKPCEQSYFAQEWFVAIVMYEEKTVDNFDWKSFRAEAAKDILCTILQLNQYIGTVAAKSQLAIKFADELINQLKEQTNEIQR